MSTSTLMRLALAAICAIAIAAGLMQFGRRPVIVSTQPDTVYLNVSARSGAVAETTHQVVTRIRTRVDSFFRFDTSLVHDTVLKRSIDTVFAACERCAAQLREHRRVSDSVIKARDDTIYALRGRLQSCKGSRPWWALGGLGLGVGACALK
jgi:hypothetical protein